jgi:flavin-dependent dehydrogenase
VKEVADALDPPRSMTRRSEGVRLYAPNLRYVDLASPGYFFLATDTPALMRWLAGRAADVGAQFRFSTPVGSVDFDARWVVGADGPRSQVARAAGLGLNTRFLVGVEAEFSGVGGVDPDRLHCFLDSRLAPGYLAWAVPGVHGLQVGLACGPPNQPDLDRCVARLARVFDFRRARERGRRGGLIPVGGPVRPASRAGVLLVGDAAGLVSPLTAGGIHTALQSGREAGHAIAEHLLHGGPDPTTSVAGSGSAGKKLLRRLLDLGPPNALYDALLGQPAFRALAATVFFHHRGLLTRAAWRDLAAAFRAA